MVDVESKGSAASQAAPIVELDKHHYQRSGQRKKDDRNYEHSHLPGRHKKGKGDNSVFRHPGNKKGIQVGVTDPDATSGLGTSSLLGWLVFMAQERELCSRRIYLVEDLLMWGGCRLPLPLVLLV